MTSFPNGICSGISYLPPRKSLMQTAAVEGPGRANLLWMEGGCLETSKSFCRQEGVCTWIMLCANDNMAE